MSVVAAERPLHDVDDPIALVRRALNDEMRARGGFLRPAMFEDAVSILLVTLVTLADKFDPARTKSFEQYAYYILRLRYTDVLRELRFDARYEDREDDLSLDEALSERAVAASAGAFEDELLASMNPDALPPDSRRTYRLLLIPIVVEGRSMEELAREHGWTRRQITSRLKQLKEDWRATLTAETA